jgi:hypothetical protein
VEKEIKQMNQYDKLEDFIKSYYVAFNALYDITEDGLRSIYLEDHYIGYPDGAPGGSAWDSESKALYCMIRLSKPKHILEIGNFKGNSTNHILLAVENNGIGDVTLVDIEDRLDYKNLHNHKFNRILTDSIKFLQETPLEYDFIAQDGCHEYQHVKKELQLLRRTMTTFDIWSHDYYARQSEVINVKRAWDEEGNIGYTWYPLKDSISNCGFVMGRYVI